MTDTLLKLSTGELFGLSDDNLLLLRRLEILNFTGLTSLTIEHADRRVAVVQDLCTGVLTGTQTRIKAVQSKQEANISQDVTRLKLI